MMRVQVFAVAPAVTGDRGTGGGRAEVAGGTARWRYRVASARLRPLVAEVIWAAWLLSAPQGLRPPAAKPRLQPAVREIPQPAARAAHTPGSGTNSEHLAEYSCADPGLVTFIA